MHDSNKNVIQLLKGVAKKTKSPIAKELVKDRDFDDACSVAHQIFYETLEEFKEGDMGWKEAVEDLSRNLLAIEMPKAKESEDGD